MATSKQTHKKKNSDYYSRSVLSKLVVISLLLSFCRLSLADCSVNFRWTEDPPFTYSANNHVIGISTEIVSLALKHMDCQLNFKKLNWARALLELEHGNIDLVSGAYKTPEREKFARYSEVPFYSPNILFLNAKNAKNWQLSELEDITKADFRLGVQINVHYGESYTNVLENTRTAQNITKHASRESLWKMLALNRIDGVIADKTTGLLEIKELGLNEQITISKVIVSQQPAYFIFSKVSTTPEFVKRFDTALRQLIDQGAIDQIEQKYLR